MLNKSLYPFAYQGTFFALCVVSVASLTSISACSLNHIFLLLSGTLLAYHHLTKEREIIDKNPISAYLLLAFVIVGIISNLTNELSNPLKSFSQIKYFLFAVVGLFAYREIFNSHEFTHKKATILLKLFLIATTLGSLSGLIALKTGWNILKFKEACHPDRACGVYGMYMSYGHGIQFFMVLVTGMVLKYKFFKEKFDIKPHYLIIIWIINGAGLILSYTRGALIGLLVAIPFFFYQQYKKIFMKLFIIIPIIAVIAFLTIPQINKMFTEPERIRSNEKRVSQYLAAYYTFKENPIWGIGVRNFEPNSVRIKEKYNLPYSDMVGHAHNNFLEILATTGILGFLLILSFHLVWLMEMHQRNDIVGYLILPLIVALFISGQTQYNLGDGENMFFLMTIYSLSQVKQASWSRLL